MNTPTGKKWRNRHTNKKVRRVLGVSDWINSKISGGKLNRANWGGALADKDIVPKFSDSWDEQLDFDVTKDI